MPHIVMKLWGSDLKCVIGLPRQIAQGSADRFAMMKLSNRVSCGEMRRRD
jgi:hypothetical protein